MPLDLANGEVRPDLGHHCHVVPAAKWLDTPFWEEAVALALKAFEKTAIDQRMVQKRWIPIPHKLAPDSVLVQEYRNQSRIVFMFQAKLGAHDFYHEVRLRFPIEAENHLILAGRWSRESVQ